ncbi:hypothetical protein K503DRAFT_777149 [Rhizopogon vinicolor AM-OR11-026]|uniref:Uncharacterized protein n=1 Tax=Rhizopogon vinicolor AM-OR11-026 TaxID=1314800 RepID=A0A1B7MH87_9AGAM|nr:hypothetical protein K503DRAFT_777149 [Rhizopogon vinicolor AM-OR11-026]
MGGAKHDALADTSGPAMNLGMYRIVSIMTSMQPEFGDGEDNVSTVIPASCGGIGNCCGERRGNHEHREHPSILLRNMCGGK